MWVENEGRKRGREGGKVGARVRAVGWPSSLANLRRVCVIFLAKRPGGGGGKRWRWRWRRREAD